MTLIWRATSYSMARVTAFSRGVRSYYFALAAAAWLYGPAWLAAAAIAATALLTWRQAKSPAAEGIRKARALLEESGS